jgi:MFS family permease
MASLFSLEKRSRLTSVIGMIWTVGTVCGPVIGGGFAEVSWVSYHIDGLLRYFRTKANYFDSAESFG